MSGDDLIRRAQENANDGGLPESAGQLIELEADETFVGRHRGHEPEWGKSGARLAWDEDGEPRYIWDCHSLTQEYERENPGLGDKIAIHRSSNYQTRYDEPGEATGRRYGLATEPCNDPLPAGGGGDDDDELY